MKYQRFGFGSAALAAALLLGSVGEAMAAQVMYDGVGFIFGQQTVTDSFSVSGPGTLTVTLQDMSFPSPLANLDLVVSTAQGLLGPETGAGTTTYRLTGGAEQVYVQALATAQGPLDAGVYGLDVLWKPTIAPVPLPASLALLASGLMLLAWQRRRAAQVD